MITLDIDKQDCKNAAELIEIYLPMALHDFYEAGGFDNLEYVRSMLRVFDELSKAAVADEWQFVKQEANNG